MTRHRIRDRGPAKLKADDPKVKTPEEIVADLRDEIWKVLASIDGLAPAVNDLQDTHQASFGYVTAEDKRAQGKAHARDLRDHATRLKNGDPVGPGESPSPGNIAGISANAQIWFTIRHQIRTLTRHVVRRTAKPLEFTAPGERATLSEVVWHLNVVIGLVDDQKLLSSALADLTRARDVASRLVDGSDDRLMDNPCPWCGNRSLVLDQPAGVITCDRDPKKAQHCICNDPMCECKQNPIKHHHTWHRAKGAKPGSWWALIDQQNRVAREQNRLNQEAKR